MAKKASYHEQFGPAVEEPWVELCFDSGTLIIKGLKDSDFARLDTKAFRLSFDPRVGVHRCPAYVYRSLLGELLGKGLSVVDSARGYAEFDREDLVERSPRVHQAEAMQAWLSAGKRGVVVLPTGAGKSHLAVMAIQDVARSALVVAPTLDLVEQWQRLLKSHFGEPVGAIGGGTHDPQALTVTTYDSAAIHMERIGSKWGLVIFDEVHHLPSDMYRWAAEAAIAPFRLGLTATLERVDGKHAVIHEIIGPTVYEKNTRELAGDVLADYEARVVEVAFSEADAELYAASRAEYRDFVEKEGIRMGGRHGWQNFLRATSRSREGRRAFKAFQRQKRRALGHENKLEKVREILHEHPNESVLIFANDNATVYALAELLLAPALTHHTPLAERAEILERFRAGRYRAVVTSRVLNEGVDVPAASIAIILSGTGSVREHVQRLGRILRKEEGKRAILYELVTPDSAETFVSQRRREHDAYR